MNGNPIEYCERYLRRGLDVRLGLAKAFVRGWLAVTGFTRELTVHVMVYEWPFYEYCVIV